MIKLKVKKKLLSTAGLMHLDVDLQLNKGSFIAISGPSGGGKTTLLRILAGLTRPDNGRIQFGNKTWLDTDQKILIPASKRNVGMVFQDYALFPNMTIHRNLLYGLAKGQDQKIIGELTRIMELEELMDRYPDTLSGGQQQRVALARALVRKPDLLLLDEPLAALDTVMRTRLQDYVLKVHQTFNLTTIIVTHDANEILKMADFLIRIEHGKILETGSPKEVLIRNFPDNNVALTGIIEAITPMDDHWEVKVKIGENVISIKADKKETEKLKVGDPIQISAFNFTPILIKKDPSY